MIRLGQAFWRGPPHLQPTCATVLDDFTRIFAGDGGGACCMWKLERNPSTPGDISIMPLALLTGTESPISSICECRWDNSPACCTLSENGSIAVWNAADGRCLMQFTEFPEMIRATPKAVISIPVINFSLVAVICTLNKGCDAVLILDLADPTRPVATLEVDIREFITAVSIIPTRRVLPEAAAVSVGFIPQPHPLVAVVAATQKRSRTDIAVALSTGRDANAASAAATAATAVAGTFSPSAPRLSKLADLQSALSGLPAPMRPIPAVGPLRSAIASPTAPMAMLSAMDPISDALALSATIGPTSPADPEGLVRLTVWSIDVGATGWATKAAATASHIVRRTTLSVVLPTLAQHALDEDVEHAADVTVVAGSAPPAVAPTVTAPVGRGAGPAGSSPTPGVASHGGSEPSPEDAVTHIAASPDGTMLALLRGGEVHLMACGGVVAADPLRHPAGLPFTSVQWASPDGAEPPIGTLEFAAAADAARAAVDAAGVAAVSGHSGDADDAAPVGTFGVPPAAPAYTPMASLPAAPPPIPDSLMLPVGGAAAPAAAYPPPYPAVSLETGVTSLPEPSQRVCSVGALLHYSIPVVAATATGDCATLPVAFSADLRVVATDGAGDAYIYAIPATAAYKAAAPLGVMRVGALYTLRYAARVGSSASAAVTVVPEFVVPWLDTSSFAHVPSAVDAPLGAGKVDSPRRFDDGDALTAQLWRHCAGAAAGWLGSLPVGAVAEAASPQSRCSPKAASAALAALSAAATAAASASPTSAHFSSRPGGFAAAVGAPAMPPPVPPALGIDNLSDSTSRIAAAAAVAAGDRGSQPPASASALRPAVDAPPLPPGGDAAGAVGRVRSPTPPSAPTRPAGREVALVQRLTPTVPIGRRTAPLDDLYERVYVCHGTSQPAIVIVASPTAEYRDTSVAPALMAAALSSAPSAVGGAPPPLAAHPTSLATQTAYARRMLAVVALSRGGAVVYKDTYGSPPKGDADALPRNNSFSISAAAASLAPYGATGAVDGSADGPGASLDPSVVGAAEWCTAGRLAAVADADVLPIFPRAHDLATACTLVLGKRNAYVVLGLFSGRCRVVAMDGRSRRRIQSHAAAIARSAADPSALDASIGAGGGGWGGSDANAHAWQAHQSSVTALRLVPDRPNPDATDDLEGRYLVTGAADGSLRVWGGMGRVMLSEILVHTAPIRSLASPPPATQRRHELDLVVVADDCAASVHSVYAGRVETRIVMSGPGEPVDSVYWREDQDLALVRYASGVVCVWSVGAGALERVVSGKMAEHIIASAVNASPHGSAKALQRSVPIGSDGLHFAEGVPVCINYHTEDSVQMLAVSLRRLVASLLLDPPRPAHGAEQPPPLPAADDPPPSTTGGPRATFALDIPPPAPRFALSPTFAFTLAHLFAIDNGAPEIQRVCRALSLAPALVPPSYGALRGGLGEACVLLFPTVDGHEMYRLSPVVTASRLISLIAILQLIRTVCPPLRDVCKGAILYYTDALPTRVTGYQAPSFVWCCQWLTTRLIHIRFATRFVMNSVIAHSRQDEVAALIRKLRSIAAQSAAAGQSDRRQNALLALFVLYAQCLADFVQDSAGGGAPPPTPGQPPQAGAAAGTVRRAAEVPRPLALPCGGLIGGAVTSKGVTQVVDSVLGVALEPGWMQHAALRLLAEEMLLIHDFIGDTGRAARAILNLCTPQLPSAGDVSLLDPAAKSAAARANAAAGHGEAEDDVSSLAVKVLLAMASIDPRPILSLFEGIVETAPQNVDLQIKVLFVTAILVRRLHAAFSPYVTRVVKYTYSLVNPRLGLREKCIEWVKLVLRAAVDVFPNVDFRSPKLAVGDGRGSVVVIDMRMVAKQQLWPAHVPHPVTAVALSPDTSLLASFACETGDVFLWNTENAFTSFFAGGSKKPHKHFHTTIVPCDISRTERSKVKLEWRPNGLHLVYHNDHVMFPVD